MRPTPSTLKLPKKLTSEAGAYSDLPGRRKPYGKLRSRKERRKADRVKNKVQRNGPPPPKRQRLENSDHGKWNSCGSLALGHLPIASLPRVHMLEVKLKPNSVEIARLPKDPAKEVLSPTLSKFRPEKLPRSVATKLEQDNAQIALLEKKLGIKSKKKLPQAFKDDGLDKLLEGLDRIGGANSYSSNTDQLAQEFLLRQHSYAYAARDSRKGCREVLEPRKEGEQVNLAAHSGEDSFDDGDDNLDESFEQAWDLEDNFEGFGSESGENPPSLKSACRKENPYVAPTSREDHMSPKYVAPSLRKHPSNTEALVRLRRQTQGLINRLTEANLLSVLGDVEKLYRENARQHVTSNLVDLLLISVCEPTTLPDTLIILSAGFIAAIYKVIGTDFGAQFIERVVGLFDQHYDRRTRIAKSGPAVDSSKETSNLITLIAELYNFQVVGSNLVFDYVRLFLQDLSELNAELLLRIVRVSGPQLRQDDPSSLRDIVTTLRPAVADIGEQNLSVRTKFMIESINDLKNNRAKSLAAASGVISEHIIRMKKTIGTLNDRNISASEPLRIGLRDIHESDKRGKWWLVGASWAENGSFKGTSQYRALVPNEANGHISVGNENGLRDLAHLAREQRMNTDIRRAIFVTVVSASDHQDACLRLMRLKLKKVQELEIPKVIIHCSSAEKHYNPYYTLIAKKLCGDKKLRMAFQFNLWDLFKRMGETNHDNDAIEANGDEGLLDTRQLVNLAKMFGALIVGGSIDLSVLKKLNLRYLQAKSQMFVEVLLVTVLLHAQLQSESGREEGPIIRIFSKTRGTPATIRGLRYFLKKVLPKKDIIGGEAELATVRWACKVAANVLDTLHTADTTKAERT